MKMIGAIIIVASSVLTGAVRAERVRKRYAALEYAAGLMRLIVTEITEHKTPTRVIFERAFSDPADVKKAQSGGLMLALEAKAEPLSDGQREILEGFSRLVGTLTAESARVELSALVSSMERELDKERGRTGSAYRVNLSLGLFFGLLSVIVLI